MELAGVSGRTPSPPGGEILRDTKGAPTGLFRETASRLLQDAYAKAREGMTPEEREAEIRREVSSRTRKPRREPSSRRGSSFETSTCSKVAAERKSASGLRDGPRHQRAHARSWTNTASRRYGVTSRSGPSSTRSRRPSSRGAGSSAYATCLEHADHTTTVPPSRDREARHGNATALRTSDRRPCNRETLNIFAAASSNTTRRTFAGTSTPSTSLADMPSPGQLGVIPPCRAFIALGRGLSCPPGWKPRPRRVLSMAKAMKSGVSCRTARTPERSHPIPKSTHGDRNWEGRHSIPTGIEPGGGTSVLTLNAATRLWRKPQRIAPAGKMADIVVLSGNPGHYGGGDREQEWTTRSWRKVLTRK